MNFPQSTNKFNIISSTYKRFIKNKNKFYNQFISQNQSLSHSICKQYPFNFDNSKTKKNIYSETIAQ